MAITFQYDDSGFNAALKKYLALRPNVEPQKELRRRAKNIGMRLIRIYKQNAPSVADIKKAAQNAGWKIKTRPAIKKRKGKRADQVKAEINARIKARTFTATGWFPAVEALGGSPRSKKGVRGPKRGRLVEKTGGSDMSETLVNLQPGAEHTGDKAGTAIQRAIEQERDDMLKYISRKLEQAAKKANL